MDTKPVIDTLSAIPLGTVVAWAVVIIAILGAVFGGVAWLFKQFEKYRGVKEENKRQKELLEEHDRMLGEIDESLKSIKDSLAEQKQVNLKQIRHTIVHTCDDALSAGSISIGKLKSLEEMYEEYRDVFNGNGYVKTMVNKVRELNVVGSLNE